MKLESRRLIIREWQKSNAIDYLKIYSTQDVQDAGVIFATILTKQMILFIH